MFQTTAFEIENGKIKAIYITRNPDKLQHVPKALAITPPESQLRH